ncbi:MAG: beta-galactosidase [Armatimonadota bacterium]
MRLPATALAFVIAAGPTLGRPQITITTGRPARTFLAGEQIELALRHSGEARPASIMVALLKASGQEIVTSDVTVGADGKASFEHAALPPGYYPVRVTLPGQEEPYRDALAVLPPVRPLADAQPSMFGVDAGVPLGENDFQAMAQCGIRWVRCDAFNWAAIEPREGEFDWAEADNAVGWAEKHGLRLLGLLGHAARWNAVVPTDEQRPWQTSPYRSHTQWDRAAQQVFQRYGDGVPLWELWNEADGAFYCGTWDRYLEMLKLTASRLREASPHGRLVYGGSAGASDLMNWTARATEGAYFDYQNGHYPFQGYDDGRGFEPPEGFRTASPQVARLHGLPQPLLITEASRGFGSKDPLEPAAELSRLLVQAAAVRCPLWCWFAWEGPDNVCLVERRGEQLVPRPLYAAHANVVHHLEGAHFLGRVPSLGRNVKSYLFVRDGEPLLVVWRLGDDAVVLPPGLVAERPAAIADFLGSPVDASQGADLPIGGEPLFVRLGAGAASALLAEAVRDSLDRLLNTKMGQPRSYEDGGPAGDVQPLKYVGTFREDLAASCGGLAPVVRAQSLVFTVARHLDNGSVEQAVVALRELRDACVGWAAVVAQKIAAHEPLQAAERKIPGLPVRPGTQPTPPDPRRWGAPTTGYPRGVEWLRRLLEAAYVCSDLATGLQAIAADRPLAPEADLAAAAGRLEALRGKLDQRGGPYARLVRTEVLQQLVADWWALARARRDADLLALAQGAIAPLEALAEAEPPLVTKAFFTVEMPSAEQLVRQRSLAAGKQHPLIVTVWNFADQPVAGALEVDAPMGWEVSGTPLNFSVPAHDHSPGLRLLLKLPPTAGGGRITISGELDTGEKLPAFWYVVNEKA